MDQTNQKALAASLLPHLYRLKSASRPPPRPRPPPRGVEVLALRSEHAVYCTDDGRVSMAGINSANVEALADAIYAVAG